MAVPKPCIPTGSAPSAIAMYFDLQKKYDLLNKSKTNSFVDPIGYQKHIAQKEKEFNEKLKRQENNSRAGQDFIKTCL